MNLTLSAQAMDLKYAFKIKLARLRGLRAQRHRKAFTGAGTLLVGSNVDLTITDKGSCIELTPATRPIERDEIRVSSYPEARSIGLPPYWRFLDPGSRTRTKIWVHSGSKLLLSANAAIHPGAYITVGNGKTLSIGTSAYLGHDVQINCRAGISIGAGCLIGQQVLLMDYDGHPVFYEGKPIPEVTYGGDSAPITVGENVWIGTKSIILKGVTIGEGAMIGAGSVVTQDVPARTIVAGNPLRVIRENVSWKRF